LLFFHRQRFIQPGETLVATAPVKKHKGLLVKKLQLLLIDKPSLILVDPAKLIITGEVPWSSDMKVRVDNTFRFKVVTVSQFGLPFSFM
jgi:3-phosphoinositide dependent protein kinase-1